MQRMITRERLESDPNIGLLIRSVESQWEEAQYSGLTCVFEAAKKQKAGLDKLIKLAIGKTEEVEDDD